MVRQDSYQQRTLQGGRDVLRPLGAVVETLEGKRRLMQAFQLRPWRAAQKGGSSKIAEEILKIQISESTYDLLKDKFLLEPRGEIEVSGKGLMKTFWLKDRLP